MTRANNTNGSSGSPDAAEQPAPAATPKRKAKKAEAAAKWTFAKNPLEEAIRVAQAIEEKYAGNPTPAPQVAEALGFNRVEDWRFGDLLRSANLYGLVEGTGATATVRLTDTAQAIVAPSSPDQRRQALIAAAMAVDDFQRVSAFYRGKKLPENEYFANTLVREFNIPRERVDTFIAVYTKNVEYLKAFDADAEGRPVISPMLSGNGVAAEPTQVGEPMRRAEIREFLDTCFVLMPFGEWPDVYYRDIYQPAIKEAGFEPVRADGLFNTGAVIEQIWEQILKAKVILAELSGKNPNVFYELGLAHALVKPVVFVSDDLNDVPFDLRHLRVVTYDVRSPSWAVDLRISITTYLRNAKADPEKSIPQPYRRHAEVGSAAS